MGCKTPLTRKALSCLYFQKMKSEELIVSDLLAICSDTPAQLQSDECVRVVKGSPPFGTKFLSTAFKLLRSSAMEMS